MPKQIRGADLLAQSLSVAGVKRLFTLSGNQIMPVFDACLDEDIELIHVRHEAAAVHMADAWGRLTGEPGIALVTAGPGHANALSAMFVAMSAESPVVLLSGQSPQSQQGTGPFQEMAQAEMAGHVAKASWTATDASALGHELARAIRTAKSGRPGPVHISLPFDVLEAIVDATPQTLPQPDDCHALLSLLDNATARNVLAELETATNPLVLAGPAMRRGAWIGLLKQLSAAVQVPVIAMESPRGTNDPSLGAVAEVLAAADLIVLLGKQADFTLRFANAPTFRADCRLIQIDPETRILERTSRVLSDPSRLAIAELADAVPAAERLIQLAESASSASHDGSANSTARQNWIDEVHNAVCYRPPEWGTLQSAEEGPLHPVELCRAIQDVFDADENAVSVSDGGEFGQWAQACLCSPNRLINGPSGSIGSVIPFAMAARVAFPESRIVATLGDGTFGFHGMEFDTAVRYGLPFVAVVGNDACWNAEHQIQLRKYGPERLVGCELLPTRYDQVVQALGGHGEYVAKPADLKPALERAVASNLPACVNVAIERHAAPSISR